MRKLILASVVLLLLTNILVLAGVAYNRSGVPLASLELTERELPVFTSYTGTDENSGTSLTLKWLVFDPDDDSDYVYSYSNNPDWLDAAKLASLGFDMKRFENITEKSRHRLYDASHETILVLEYQGEAHRRALQHAKEKLARHQDNVLSNPEDEKLTTTLTKFEDQLEQFIATRSRLYVIDAGLDLQALLEQYSEQGKYMFARGEIGLSWNEDEDTITGRIKQIFIDDVHVSLPQSKQLSQLKLDNGYGKANGEAIPPRYRVLLNIGQRLEPWVESVAYENKAK